MFRADGAIGVREGFCEKGAYTKYLLLSLSSYTDSMWHSVWRIIIASLA